MSETTSSADTTEQLRRWRLVLGKHSELGDAGSGRDAGMDQALESLYDAQRGQGLSGSGRSALVARWLGDIRDYFPTSVVQVLQNDALERLGLHQMLTQKEMLQQVEPDIHLVGTLLSLKDMLPSEARETAREVVGTVVREIEERLQGSLVRSVQGALNKSARTRNPRAEDIDWDATIRANLHNFQPSLGTPIVETLRGGTRTKKTGTFQDVVVCVDQSGSMASSVVYAGVLGASLATIRSVSTSMVAFDTEVADLTDLLSDPVEVLFGTQLGGGTDINKALAYCQGLVHRPSETTLILISDLYENGDKDAMVQRCQELTDSGVKVIALLALNDEGAPSYDKQMAQRVSVLGIPVFACTPDLFPDLLAEALQGNDLSHWGK